MNAAETYWTSLYAEADKRVEDDETAAPQQHTHLGQQYYYTENVGVSDGS